MGEIYVEKCLRPACSRPANCRGLCRRCHAIAHRLVQKGDTTWDELEENGKTRPPGYGKFCGTTKWLLERKARKG